MTLHLPEKFWLRHGRAIRELLAGICEGHTSELTKDGQEIKKFRGVIPCVCVYPEVT